jgi:lipid-A-disaccharide synthase
LVAIKILVSAGEASGELYAAPLVNLLRERLHDVEFFGCAGPKMRQAGVRPVVDAASLSVVGLVEVVAHIPRIYKDFRRLVRSAEAEKPDLAILTDSPDFHLRLAARLKRLGIPVVYLVAPQVWAWRKGRISTLRRNLDQLLCIFPFEENFFRNNQVSAEYIGHPLARLVKPKWEKREFFERYGLKPDRPLIALLPGSRNGERARHMPYLEKAAELIHRNRRAEFVLAVPPGVAWGGTENGIIRCVEGETWDVLAHSDLALAASGTVTIEAAVLRTPMVTFYRVNRVSWWLGKFLVQVPFYSMVNLVAGRKIVPELMQSDMTPERLAAEATRLLDNRGIRDTMREELGQVSQRLASVEDPLSRAAAIIEGLLQARGSLNRISPESVEVKRN